MTVNAVFPEQSIRAKPVRPGNLTPDQALKRLQEAAILCQQAGIEVNVSPFYNYGQRSVVIVMTNVELHSGHLVMAKEGRWDGSY